MDDLISRQRVIKSIDKFIPADPMKNEYTQGISVGLAIATRCVEEFSQENDDSSQVLVKDLISRQEAKDAIDMALDHIDHVPPWVYDKLLNALNEVPSVKPTHPTPSNTLGALDCIDRAEAIKAVKFYETFCDPYPRVIEALRQLPSVQPQTSTITIGRTKGRVTMWYECDHCGEPIDFKDNYCRNCGRRLLKDG